MARDDRAKGPITVGRRKIEVTNLDKPLFPETGFTKGELISYYRDAAPVILPHLKNRPLTMKRYPDGVDGEFFYEKHAPRFTPAWATTHDVPKKTGGAVKFILVNDAATLVWAANLAAIELHVLLARAPYIAKPTSLVFDLDPGAPADLLACIEVGFILRSLFRSLNLECFPKVSGSKGLQVYVPLNSPVTYDTTKPFAETVARYLEQEHPDLVVSKMTKKLRQGKVFVDWSQNDEHKSTVCVYSVRAKHAEPFVSLPFSWEELKRAARRDDASSLYLSPRDALRRIKKKGDLFAPVNTLRQKLPPAFHGASSSVRSTKTAPSKEETGLQAYNKKRDFRQTAEPRGNRGKGNGGLLQFVIQKHQASHLHYDFRLEMAGVLRSWAVPKGPPIKRGEKRLAMHVEDHPLDYADFEGIIPEGNYGAGTVMVWDRGTYELQNSSPVAAYNAGKMELTLHGKKLDGDFHLVRMKDREKEWLLIKSGKDQRVKARSWERSVLTGRTLDEIAHAAEQIWQSDRPSTKAAPTRRATGRQAKSAAAKKRSRRTRKSSR